MDHGFQTLWRYDRCVFSKGPRFTNIQGHQNISHGVITTAHQNFWSALSIWILVEISSRRKHFWLQLQTLVFQIYRIQHPATKCTVPSRQWSLHKKKCVQKSWNSSIKQIRLIIPPCLVRCQHQLNSINCRPISMDTLLDQNNTSFSSNHAFSALNNPMAVDDKLDKEVQ